jgi:hypothetical protein
MEVVLCITDSTPYAKRIIARIEVLNSQTLKQPSALIEKTMGGTK